MISGNLTTLEWEVGLEISIPGALCGDKICALKVYSLGPSRIKYKKKTEGKKFALYWYRERINLHEEISSIKIT